MPLPRPDDAQIAWVIRQVAEYIQQQRQTYRQSAASLNATQMAAIAAVLSKIHFGLDKGHRAFRRAGWQSGVLRSTRQDGI